jgi:ADP-ribose pyrophosphatase YjhB (NUDIX family)
MEQRWRPSVTVAAIIEKDGRFLLVEEETSHGLRLNNPAGHLDPGESPAEGCARETLEETAWRFRPTHFLGFYISRFIKRADGEDVTYIRLAFCGELLGHDAGRALDDGIHRTLWMTPDEIRANSERLRSPLVLRCMEDFLRGVRYPLSLIYADPSLYAPTQVK